MGGMIFIILYGYNLIRQLEKDSGLRITKSSQFAAKRDLRKVVNNNVDNSLKTISNKIIKLIKLSNWLFFGAIGLIIIIFVLNAVFNWQV